MNDRPLVSADWLHDHLGDPDIRVVDASWHMPATGRNGQAEYLDAHIPSAVFFDLDEHSAVSHLPHMMPSADTFATVVAGMGISESDQIVVYDSLGLFSAARVWWMFRYFGASRVWVLDGGLPGWKASRYPLESGCSRPSAGVFNTSTTQCRIANASEVLQATGSGHALVLDARSRTRFSGLEPEVRPGLRSGHIPGSHCMPYTELMEDGRLKSNEQLRQLLAQRGVTSASPVITTCGSGVTAAIINLALECLNHPDAALYDGSWTEWGAEERFPVATAP
ncbi:MAG: 3-mercaptopyruvate sulfurtransferase [Granulosicoccus sp.]|nr:3-mercaptopyruvate sulfurtransferase [Granulosicoccus sp.]